MSAMKAKPITEKRKERLDELGYDICTEIDNRITDLKRHEQEYLIRQLEDFVLNYTFNDA